MKDGRADARAAAAGRRGDLRGLPERRAAGRGSRLPAGAGGARLRTAARARGPARLLSLALALPRRRRDVPAGRQGGRRLPGRRPPHGRDGIAARPRSLAAGCRLGDQRASIQRTANAGPRWRGGLTRRPVAETTLPFSREAARPSGAQTTPGKFRPPQTTTRYPPGT